jgi:hypothetical protein
MPLATLLSFVQPRCANFTCFLMPIARSTSAASTSKCRASFAKSSRFVLSVAEPDRFALGSLHTQLLQVHLYVFHPEFLTSVELELLAPVLDRFAWLGCGMEL